MQVQLLIHPRNQEHVAEVIFNERNEVTKINFFNSAVIPSEGIAVTKSFHDHYKSKWRVLPQDPLFNLAFMKCLMTDLREQGYFLRPKSELDGLNLSPQDFLQKVQDAYKKE